MPRQYFLLCLKVRLEGLHSALLGPADSILVVQAPTQVLNPAFSEREIRRAYAEDPVAAAAEYGAEFRADVESFVSREAVETCTVPDRRELPRVEGVTYRAFVDPSGGGADSFALAIGHREERDGQPVAVLDAVRERRPPFSPETVVEEYASLLKTYRVTKVTGDRYAGEWPREAFLRHGVAYEPAAKSKSDLYRAGRDAMRRSHYVPMHRLRRRWKQREAERS